MKIFFILGILLSVVLCYAMDNSQSNNNDARVSYQQQGNNKIQNILAFLRSKLPPGKDTVDFIDQHAFMIGVLVVTIIGTSKL